MERFALSFTLLVSACGLLVSACGTGNRGNDSEAMLRNQAVALSAQADEAANAQIEQINAGSITAPAQPAATH